MRIFKIILLIVAISFINSVKAQHSYNDLYNALDYDNEMKILVNSTIDALAQENPHIPSDEWDIIKRSIDYSVFRNRIVKVFKANYTLEEVKKMFLHNDMIESIKEPGEFIFTTSKEVSDQLYREGKLGGRELMQQALLKLREYLVKNE